MVGQLLRVYEALLYKTALKKIFGRSSLDLQELETVLCEVEAVVYSRSLTYMYSSAQEPSPI